MHDLQSFILIICEADGHTPRRNGLFASSTVVRIRFSIESKQFVIVLCLGYERTCKAFNTTRATLIRFRSRA